MTTLRDMDDLTDVTLRRIDEAINQDVEMQASYLSQHIDAGA